MEALEDGGDETESWEGLLGERVDSTGKFTMHFEGHLFAASPRIPSHQSHPSAFSLQLDFHSSDKCGGMLSRMPAAINRDRSCAQRMISYSEALLVQSVEEPTYAPYPI